MTIYWILFFILIILSTLEQHQLFNKKTYNYTIILTCIFIIFIIGFRYNSVDYIGYKEHYYLVQSGHIGFPLYLMYESGSEFLFSSMMVLFKSIKLPFFIFIFVFSVISLSIKFIVFKKYSPYFFLSLVLFFSFLVHKDLGQIRNAMIAAIMLIAVFFIYKRKIFHFSFTIFTAFCIHFFILISLPIYWLYPLLRNNYTVIIILIIATLTFLSGGLLHHIEPILSSNNDIYIFRRLLRYINDPIHGEEVSLNINVISQFFFAIILISLKKSYLKKGSYQEGLYVVYIYGFFMYLIFSDVATLSARTIELIVYLPLTILIPYYIYQIQRNSIRYFIYYLIIIFATIRFIPTSSNMEIYQNVLFK